jgi:hypothetical protein
LVAGSRFALLIFSAGLILLAMPVESVHPQYEENSKKWERARDVIAGEDTVKGKGTAYLPKLSSQDQNEYGRYVTRSRFFNATARTLQALHGIIFRKLPTIDPEAFVKKYGEDIDMRGNSFVDYCKEVTKDVIAVGRGGTLVDWSDNEARPYFCFCPAESIINWQTKRVNGRIMLSLVVMKEETTDPLPANIDPTEADGGEGDKYEPNCTEKIRVLELVSNGVNPQGVEVMQYVAEEYRYGKLKGETAPTWILTERKLPGRRGVPLGEIPFAFHGSENCNPSINKVPLLDVISINLHHYRTDAELNHALYFCGNPTAWVAGFDTKTELKIGSSTAWVSDNPNAKAGYLEFTGQGLKPISDELVRDQNMMAVLGAQLLGEQKRAVESAESHQIRQGGESATLMDIVYSVSASLSRVLKFAVWWEGTMKLSEVKATVELNADLVAGTIEPARITAMVGAVQAGVMSLDSLIWNLRQGEALPPGRTIEQEKELLKENSEFLLGPPMPLGGEDDKEDANKAE